MGVFILSRDGAGPGDGDGTIARQFGAPWQRAAAGLRLRVHGTLEGLPPDVVERDDGDFAAVSGTLYYRGRSGRAALAALGDDFDGRRFPWAECRGHYAVLLGRRQRWFLANDALGAYKIYHDRDGRIFSSSFLAVQQAQPCLSLDRQGCYEYAWNGATFGDKTFFDEIRMLRKGTLLAFDPEPTVVAESDLEPVPAPLDFEATARQQADRLRGLIRVYAAGAGRVRMALSGGYDSRLILALLLDAGVRPELFVYGPESSADVQLARAVAAGQGLAIEAIDLGQRVPRLDASERMVRAHDAFDGWKENGLFDSGAEREERLARAAGDRLLLNGSAGEIYRNFFNLPDGRLRLRHLVWAFYSYLDPSACTSAFDATEYEDRLIDDMRAAIGASSDTVSRAEIEALYPQFRGRYWTARGLSINCRFGRTLCPFLEAAVVAGTESIPIAFKNFGRLEARLIELIWPSLAAYPSTRGFRPIDAVPFRYRLEAVLNMRRPAWIRTYSYLLRQLRPPSRPELLRAAALRRFIDPAFPRMSALFRPERIHDPAVLNRLCTMELLCSNPARRLEIGVVGPAPVTPSAA
jgi:asparagine synthase (glutamine-hydrolysing)